MKYVGTNVDTNVNAKVWKQSGEGNGPMVVIAEMIEDIPTVAHHLLVKVKTERWYVLQANQKLSTLLKSVIPPMSRRCSWLLFVIKGVSNDNS